MILHHALLLPSSHFSQLILFFDFKKNLLSTNYLTLPPTNLLSLFGGFLKGYNELSLHKQAKLVDNYCWACECSHSPFLTVSQHYQNSLSPPYQLGTITTL